MQTYLSYEVSRSVNIKAYHLQGYWDELLIPSDSITSLVWSNISQASPIFNWAKFP